MILPDLIWAHGESGDENPGHPQGGEAGRAWLLTG